MERIKQLRLIIIITCIVGLLSLFSWTMTALAWGTSETTIYFLLLYPIFFISTILIIANIRFAYFLTIFVALAYVTLLNRDIGNLLVFNRHNNALYFVLALPYFILLALIPLTASYLAATSKHKRVFVTIAIIAAMGFPTFAIAERSNMNYFDNIFVDAEIDEQGQVRLKCKPGFADARSFTLIANSSEFTDKVKKYGEYYQGSYFLHNTTLKKHFTFSTLKSITITNIGKEKIVPELTWTTNEIKGDVSFLQP